MGQAILATCWRVDGCNLVDLGVAYELNNCWRRVRELGLKFETSTFERCNTLGMPLLNARAAVRVQR